MNEKDLFGRSLKSTILSRLKVEEILPDSEQPRQHFDEEELDGLASSFLKEGIIQPLVVRSNPDGKGYIIIAGERRWRAARKAGFTTVPTILRDDLNARTAALIENIQRVNLKPVEEAEAIAKLMAEENMTQKETAEILGKSLWVIKQTLQIRRLPEEIKTESMVHDTPWSILMELCRVSDRKTLARLWKKYKKTGITRQEIRAAKQKKAPTPPAGGESVVVERALRRAERSVKVLRTAKLNDEDRGRLEAIMGEIERLV